MPKAPPVEKEFAEKEPDAINDLKELRDQAKVNTSKGKELREFLDELEQDIKELLQQDMTAEAQILSSRQAEAKKEFAATRVRGGALLRRRNRLRKTKTREAQGVFEQHQEDTRERLKVSAIKRRANELHDSLMAFAQDVELAALGVYDPNQNELVKRLKALARSSQTAATVLKRSPSLETQETEVDQWLQNLTNEM